MKNYYLFLLSLLIGSFVCSQVGIGINQPDASAALDVTATNKGILVPRVTLNNNTLQLSSATNATGLLVYNVGGTGALTAGYYFWNGSEWRTIDNTTAATPTIGSIQ